jgi:hypothetical protein
MRHRRWCGIFRRDVRSKISEIQPISSSGRYDDANTFPGGSQLKSADTVYALSVVLLMAVLPLASIGGERIFHGLPLMPLVGKWFVFWGAGVRLVLAGVRQFFQPRFTAEKIFNIRGNDALPVIRELGVANFATGVAGMASLGKPSFILPVAITAAIFYGIAGIRHLADGGRTANENIAMISDLLVALVFAAYVVFVALGT